MGNNEAGDHSATSSETEKTTSAADDRESLTHRPRAGSLARRIVKAATPKASTDQVSAVEVSSDKEKVKNDGDDDDDDEPEMQVLSSPSVTREMLLNQAEKVKQYVLQTATERQRHNRDKEKEERRKAPSHTLNQKQPNPMSRFLSVFSVEPTHPEHKRSYQVSPVDQELELAAPSGKKLRASDTAVVDRDSVSTGVGSEPGRREIVVRSTTIMLISAVAVAAIAAVLARRWKRGP